MVKKLLRKWLGIERPVYPPDTYEEGRSAISALGESSPSIMVYRVSNGYIVRTFDRALMNQTMKIPVLTYCKDHTEIAEHIVAEQARATLGVGHQYEMDLGTSAIRVTSGGYTSTGTYAKPNY